MLLRFVFVVLGSLTVPSIVSAAALGRGRHEYPNQRKVKVENKSGRRLEVFWINNLSANKEVTYHANSEGGEGYAYGADTYLLTFIGHEFEIRELPGTRSNKCLYEECRKGYFKVNEQENQEVTIDKDFKVVHLDDVSRAEVKVQDLWEHCQETTKEKLSPAEDLEFQLEAMAECMLTQVEGYLEVREEERSFHHQVQSDMAEKLVPYACGDPSFNEDATFSKEHLNRTWHYKVPRGDKNFQIQVFHERPTSQILSVKEFAGYKECAAIQTHINEALNQVPFIAMNDDQALQTLMSKMYEFLRVFVGWKELNLQHTHALGHELFDVHKDATMTNVPRTCTKEDETDEQGECKSPGAPPLIVETKDVRVKPAQVATVFLFCDEPKAGLGGLHFPKAGVHISPERGKLVVAVHRPGNGDVEPDDYLQQYHFCPNHDVYTHNISLE